MGVLSRKNCANIALANDIVRSSFYADGRKFKFISTAYSSFLCPSVIDFQICQTSIPIGNMPHHKFDKWPFVVYRRKDDLHKHFQKLIGFFLPLRAFAEEHSLFLVEQTNINQDLKTLQPIWGQFFTDFYTKNEAALQMRNEMVTTANIKQQTKKVMKRGQQRRYPTPNCYPPRSNNPNSNQKSPWFSALNCSTSFHWYQKVRRTESSFYCVYKAI